MRSDRALLVEIPATELCTFVPIVPGGLGGRGTFGSFNLGSLGGLGGRIRTGFREPPTREVAIGGGERIADSQSESVNIAGESGLGGGSTSPGMVNIFFRCLLGG